jgi:predicted acyl esterase
MHGWLTGINEIGFEANFTTHEGLTSYWDNVTFTNKWDLVTAPGVHLTGWYDIFNQQQIEAYDAYQTRSSFGRNLNYLVILPTGHCAGGEV